MELGRFKKPRDSSLVALKEAKTQRDSLKMELLAMEIQLQGYQNELQELQKPKTELADLDLDLKGVLVKAETDASTTLLSLGPDH